MTTTADTAHALTTALTTIRNLWPIMHQPSTSSVAGKPQPKALYTATDDNADTNTDILKLDALVSLRAETTTMLHGWARILVEDRKLTHGLPLGSDTEGLCRLLERHADWLSGHEAGPDMVDEITTAARRLHHTAYPSRRDHMIIGRCPIEHDLGPCGGKVRAKTGEDGATCQACGEWASIDWWYANIIGNHDAKALITAGELVTLAAFEQLVVLERATIRQWVHRGVLTPHPDRDVKGRQLFDRAEALALVAKKRRTANAG